MMNRVLSCCVLSPLLMSCSGSVDKDCGEATSVHHVIVTSLGYMRASDEVSEGYDIDGTDEAVCGIDDFVDPDGAVGIDNGLAKLIPALEASEAKVVEGYMNSAIIEGRLLIVLEISRVDDLMNDDCVDVEFLQAKGEPLLGTDGGILPGQTLQRDPELPSAKLEGLSIVDGRIDVAPMDIDLPISLLDANFELNMRDGGIRVELGEDGVAAGYFTGALHKDEFEEILESSPGVDNDVVDLLDSILGLALDIQSDNGQCDSISAGVVYSGAAIYLMD